MAIERIHINPEVIVWAINRAGYDEDAFYDKNASVKKWVDGDRLPTVKQLKDFAESVHLPFGYLFLPERPKESIPIPFFRTVDHKSHFNLKLYDTIIDLKRKQDWLSDYIASNDIDYPKFIGCCDGKDITDTIAVARELLDISPDWLLKQHDSSSAVSKMISQMEEIGCIVSVQGYVGTNNRRKLEVVDCRGFSLIDSHAPFIFVNNGDTKEAQLFTLVHEFAHLLIGFSSGFGGGDGAVSDDHREWFCDKVAAMFLVDGEVLRQKWNGDIDDMARMFRVSRLMMARRAHELHLIDEASYRRYMEMYWAYVNSNPKKPAKKDGGHGDYYRTMRRRLGFGFLIHLRNAVLSSQLTYNDAYRLIGCKGDTFDKLISNKTLLP